jgi:hypothetical protein
MQPQQAYASHAAVTNAAHFLLTRGSVYPDYNFSNAQYTHPLRAHLASEEGSLHLRILYYKSFGAQAENALAQGKSAHAHPRGAEKVE